MSTAQVFDCPSCSAPLNPDGAQAMVHCPFCGESVIVPPELRAAGWRGPPAMFPPPATYTPPVTPPFPAIAAPPRSRGCGPVLGVLFLMILFGSIWAGNNPAAFQAIQSLVAPGLGQVTLTFGGSGSGPGRLQNASGLAIDGAGNVYVGDQQPGRIVKFNGQGQFLTSWPIGDYYPHALAADRLGNVYAVANGLIQKWDGTTGTQLATFKFDDLIEHFDTVTTLPDGGLWTTLSLSVDDLVRLDGQGRQVSRLPHLARNQTGKYERDALAVDGLGNLFVLGTGSNTVLQFNRDGKFVNRFGSAGNAADQFDTPTRAIAVDDQSRVYVSDFKGLQVFEANGHYLGRITLPSPAQSLAFNDRNELFALSTYTNQVYKLQLQNSHGSTLAPLTPRTGPTQAPAPTESAARPATATPRATLIPPAPTVEPLHGIGDTITFENWVISLARTDLRTRLVYSDQGDAYQTDGQFALLWVDARNLHPAGRSLSDDFVWELQDSADDTYDAITLSDVPGLNRFLSYEGRTLLDASVPAHGLTHPLLIFNIPATTHPAQLILTSTATGEDMRFTLPQ